MSTGRVVGGMMVILQPRRAAGLLDALATEV
jgi:hypothetical protein